jgi:DoxX-like protein
MRLADLAPETRISFGMKASPSSEKDGQMSKISWPQVPASALAAFFVVGSLSNIFAPGSIYEEYLRWGYPHWFHFVTGSLELATAVLLAQSRTRLWGAALGCGVMLAAFATRHPPRRIRARRAAAYRGDALDSRRLDRLAEAAPQAGMTAAICGSSRSEPVSLVNIELDRTVVTHLQKERLAIVLMLDVHALHDLEGFQGLFAKSNQDLFSVSHWSPMGVSRVGLATRRADRRQRMRHLT